MNNKRLFVLTLAACLMAWMLIFPASAAVYSGTCGDNVTWEYDDATGTLRFSGTGAICYEGVRPWSDCSFKARQIVIEEGITSIQRDAFANFSRLQSVTLADTITAIERNAFAFCEALTDVSFGNGLTTIGEFAFGTCSEITNITLPASISNLSAEAFGDCYNLKGIAVPAGVTVINNGTFRACHSMTCVYIPASVTAINYAAFRGCESLTDVYFGGTQEQWEAIDINDSNEDPYRGNNEYLLAATVHYNHSHSWDNGSMTTTATCIKNGRMTYACADCPAGRIETASKTDHTWDGGSVTTEATCTKDGVKTYTCTVCGTEKTQTITATDHSWGTGKKNADTTVSYTCTKCSAVKTEGTSAVVTKPPSKETTKPVETTAETTVETTVETTLPEIGDTGAHEHTDPPLETAPTANDDIRDTKGSIPWGALITGAVVLLAGGVGIWVWQYRKRAIDQKK